MPASQSESLSASHQPASAPGITTRGMGQGGTVAAELDKAQPAPQKEAKQPSWCARAVERHKAMGHGSGHHPTVELGPAIAGPGLGF